MTPKDKKRSVMPTIKAGRTFQYQPLQLGSVTLESFIAQKRKSKELFPSGKLDASGPTVKPVWAGRHFISDTTRVSVKKRGDEKNAQNNAIAGFLYISIGRDVSELRS